MPTPLRNDRMQPARVANASLQQTIRSLRDAGQDDLADALVPMLEDLQTRLFPKSAPAAPGSKRTTAQRNPQLEQQQ